MEKQKTKIYITLFLLIISLSNLLAQFDPPLPDPATANIDGEMDDWESSPNLDETFFADMYKAGNTSKDLLAKCYLRYNCTEPQTLYVLVLTQEDFIIDDSDIDDHWIKIYDLGNNSIPYIDFEYIFDESNNKIGWEASYNVASSESAYLQFEVHAQVFDDETSRTNPIPLDLDCDALPVELSSFSATIKNNIASLEWQTATEVNNFGFEIQRSSESEKWNKVGFVEGHGNSNSPKYYSFTDQSISGSGEYYYRLKQIDIDGQFEYSDVVNINFSAPLDYELNQNYPNPFNPSTTISYSIPQKSNVELIVYNLFGEEVARLVNETKEAGTYSVSFNAQNMASGMYFYSIETENYKATKKFILLK